MDPQPLSASEWGQIGTVLMFLWAALGCAIIAGFSLLTAHALITSLVDTNTIPAGFSKLRPLFYAVGIVAFIGIIFFFVLAAVNLDWLDIRYSRYWQ